MATPTVPLGARKTLKALETEGCELTLLELVDAVCAVTEDDTEAMATILHMFGIDERLQFVNTSGRPVYLVQDGQPIPELV